MHYEELVELNTMGRELDEDEKKMLKKDAWSKCGKGIILLLLLLVAIGILTIILLKINENNIAFRGRGARKTAGLIFAMLVSAVAYIFITFKHSFVALLLMKKVKMVEVREINFKELDKAGYKHYGDVKVRINGVVTDLEVPIMRDSVKMVKWQRKGKLYFVPNKYYVLSKVD